MRKIVAGLFMSLDGVVEAPEQWQFPYFNDEMGQALGAAMATSDTLLLGRRTYQEFAAVWPGRGTGDPVGAWMNTTPKMVVSTTLDTVAWQPSTLLGGDLAEQLGTMKQQPGKHIQVSGSATLVRWLLGEGLLDELGLLVCPIVVGRGRRLFQDWSQQLPLRLVDATTFSTGVLSLTYAPAATNGAEPCTAQQEPPATDAHA
jgi:dihydrofolate reductase